MKNYVLSFIFTPDFKQVWLTEKQSPEWQKGALNGIGGKVKLEDFSLLEAMERELFEASGCTCPDLRQVGYIEGVDDAMESFRVSVFTAISSEQLASRTEEPIHPYWLHSVEHRKHVENVLVLISLCKYAITCETCFTGFHIKY